VQTWPKWREDVEGAGMTFAASPDYQVFPTLEKPLKPYAAAVKAARESEPLMREYDPEIVVADILTIATALAAQVAGKPWVTLVPHVMPTWSPGFPIYSIGAVLPRSGVGRRAWDAFRPLSRRGEEQGRLELNGARARVGLPPLGHIQGGISHQLALVATFPQLEYPRGGEGEEPWVRVTGPLLYERPCEDIELPPGDDPLILVASSTSQDPGQRLLRAALDGLAGEPVRILVTTNRSDPTLPTAVPPNARLVEWASYARTMPHCAAVISHVGHGTLASALAAGVPVIACPAAGDQPESAARIRWAGVGVSVPRRFQTPRGVRLATRRLLSDPSYAERAGELKRWAEENDGATRAADELEAFAADAILTPRSPVI
jgi:UDP:flavonoid glycosyltransferase YjiC (YdhE family)